MVELRINHRHFLLVLDIGGHKKWLGIYGNERELKEAYDEAFNLIDDSSERQVELQVYLFVKGSNLHEFVKLSSEDLNKSFHRL